MHRLITIIHSKHFGTWHDCLGIFRYLKVIANEIKHCFQGQVAWPLLCFSFKFTRSWPAIFLGLVIVHFLSNRFHKIYDTAFSMLYIRKCLRWKPSLYWSISTNHSLFRVAIGIVFLLSKEPAFPVFGLVCIFPVLSWKSIFAISVRHGELAIYFYQNFHVLVIREAIMMLVSSGIHFCVSN